MIDLSRLTPAPWEIKAIPGIPNAIYIPKSGGFPMLLPEDDDSPEDVTALQFAALARNAFAGNPEAMAWWEQNRTRRENA